MNLQISKEAVALYRTHGETLIDHVNRFVAGAEDIHRLIGGNPLEMMYANHQHHHAFMAEVFELSSYPLLEKMVPWVYRTYHAHGFAFDYFLVEFHGWQEALETFLPQRIAQELMPVYSWFIDEHPTMIAVSSAIIDPPPEVSPAFQTFFPDLLHLLLAGKSREVLTLGAPHVQSPVNLVDFYLGALQPALYRVGQLWEEHTISVAQEHLASGVVNRAMAHWYFNILGVKVSKGRAVVTSAPNELHAIGGHMLADLLTLDGWDVVHLGSNTPAQELLPLLRTNPPDILAISVCMPFNISKARDTIAALRAETPATRTKVMVGGQAFSLVEGLWQTTGADGYATDGKSAVALAAEWWGERPC